MDTARSNVTDSAQHRRDTRLRNRIAPPSRQGTYRLVGDEKDQGDQLIYLVSQRLRSDIRAAEIARRQDSIKTWTRAALGAGVSILLSGVAFIASQSVDQAVSGFGATIITITLISLGVIGGTVLAFVAHTLVTQRRISRQLREAQEIAREAEYAALIRHAVLAAQTAAKGSDDKT